jgi:esterase
MKEADQLEHIQLALKVSGLKVSEVVLPSSRHAVLGGLRLHYLDWGNPGAEPVLFLHGGSLTARTWDLVCLALRDGYHCVAMDMRGHGDSEWPPDADYSFEAGERDISNLVDHLGWDRFALVGMSMGGLNSMQFAGDHSQRITGLVLVDVGPDLNVDGARRIVSFTRDDREMATVEDFVARAMRFNPRRNPQLLRRSLHHNLRQLPSGSWTWKWDPRRMEDVDFDAMASRHRLLWHQIRKADCPALVVRGADSDVLTAEAAALLAGALPRGHWVEVPDAGHTVQGDNPVGLVQVLRPFLAAAFGGTP